MRFENIQSVLPKEVRGQSWPWRSLQKHVKMTSNYLLVDGLSQSWPWRSLQRHVEMTFNYILVDGLGWDLRIFNLTHQKRSEPELTAEERSLQTHVKMTSKYILVDGLEWDLRIFNLIHQERSEPKLTLEVTSKTCQNDFKLLLCGWFGMRFENIQSDPPRDVRSQSWPQRSLQKHVKIISNYILLDGLAFEVILTCFWSDLQG